MKKIIIWLFEKYAYDYWVDLQEKQQKEQIMKDNNLETEDEFMDWHRDKTQEPLRQAYEAGHDDGYNKAVEDGANL